MTEAKKMTVINVVVDEDTKAMVRQVSEREKRTMSQWVRLLIEQALQRETQAEAARAGRQN